MPYTQLTFDVSYKGKASPSDNKEKASPSALWVELMNAELEDSMWSVTPGEGIPLWAILYGLAVTLPIIASVLFFYGLVHPDPLVGGVIMYPAVLLMIVELGVILFIGIGWMDESDLN